MLVDSKRLVSVAEPEFRGWHDPDSRVQRIVTTNSMAWLTHSFDWWSLSIPSGSTTTHPFIGC